MLGDSHIAWHTVCGGILAEDTITIEKAGEFDWIKLYQTRV